MQKLLFVYITQAVQYRTIFSFKPGDYFTPLLVLSPTTFRTIRYNAWRLVGDNTNKGEAITTWHPIAIGSQHIPMFIELITLSSQWHV